MRVNPEIMNNLIKEMNEGKPTGRSLLRLLKHTFTFLSPDYNEVMAKRHGNIFIVPEEILK